MWLRRMMKRSTIFTYCWFGQVFLETRVRQQGARVIDVAWWCFFLSFAEGTGGLIQIPRDEEGKKALNIAPIICTTDSINSPSQEYRTMSNPASVHLTMTVNSPLGSSHFPSAVNFSINPIFGIAGGEDHIHDAAQESEFEMYALLIFPLVHHLTDLSLPMQCREAIKGRGTPNKRWFLFLC